MVNLGLLSEIKPVVSVNVKFRIPYYTQWGQSLVVCGSEPVLGSGIMKKGLLLTPFHEGGELIWGGSLTVPVGFKSEYNYYVVDDVKNVLRWEVGNKRKLVLPDGVENGKVVELHDLWQTNNDLTEDDGAINGGDSEGSQVDSQDESLIDIDSDEERRRYDEKMELLMEKAYEQYFY